MPHVVAEPCAGCKFTDCVSVCPVDAFREGVDFLVIDPERCIDCGLCVPECPVNAIYADDDLPEKWAHYLQLNAEYARTWPEITAPKEPLSDTDKSDRGKDDSV